MKTLASRLTSARLEKRLTQGELAKKSGVSQSTIGNLEAGIRLSSRSITLIAAALGVNALWLAEGKGSILSGITEQELLDVIARPEMTKLHPDIQAVINIMEMTDDDGKTLIRIKAQELAQLREPFLKTTTPTANKVLNSSSLMSSETYFTKQEEKESK